MIYPALKWLRISCSIALSVSVLLVLLSSRSWPLVGDASIMHYIVFLMRQGLVPYKDIADINLPGTYFFEALGMRIFGDGAIGWRLYDVSLLAMILAASITLGRKMQSWFPGFVAGGMVAVIHFQDGIFQVGQRDLLMAALLLWAYVALFEAQTRKRPYAALLLFGILIGTTATIKPILAPLGLVLLCMVAFQLRKRDVSPWKTILAGCAGAMLPLTTAALWLYTAQALPSFLAICRGLLVLHSSLGRKPFRYLALHSIAPIGVVVLGWIVLILFERLPLTAFRSQLYVGIAGTMLAYIAQGKGYPYQRYPLLAVLLLVLCCDLDRILIGIAPSRFAAAALFLAMSVLLAPFYCWTATHFSPATPFQNALGVELDHLGTTQDLSGNVQCLDTFGGCIGVLYQHRIVQPTGFLYDCYLFTPPSPTREAYRSAFLTQFLSKPPRLIIETNQFCFGGSDGFSKLSQWPKLERLLTEQYDLETEWKSAVLQHWWNRKDEPVKFRIYKRHQASADKAPPL